MRHDWLFEVLQDLLTYSRRNRFVRLAEQIEGAIVIAREETAGSGPDAPEDGRGV